MTEFLKLIPPDEARRLLLATMAPQPGREEQLATGSALHRVTARPIMAPHGLPEFSRSTVDGYAVMAGDTFGAGGSQPAYLELAGEVAMGSAPGFQIASGKCALIHTGGMLPTGADAVVMLEHTQLIGQPKPGSSPAGEIEILRAAAPGENVIAPGEDVTSGQVVLEAGREIRPQEIGGLLALGIGALWVRARPRVAIISTGDEIVEPSAKPAPGQVRDVNGACLAALLMDHGAEPVSFGIVPDDAGLLQDVAGRALAACDMVVITAGSSASTRDLTAATIQSLGSPGVLVHGINIRPGKPTIIGVCEGKPVVGLPGNPVSAYVVARLVVLPAVSQMLGRDVIDPPPSIAARLSVNIPSLAGREDWWPVKLEAHPSDVSHRLAVPIFGRSNLIFNLVSADGLVRIAPDTNGLEAGSPVQVQLF